MTPSELRALVEATTPGKWRVNDDWSDYGGPEAGPEGAGWIDPHGAYSSKRSDNLLMAMAPDLARLCAEQHEALSWALSSLETVLARRPHRAIPEMRACGEAALAKLSELEAR